MPEVKALAEMTPEEIAALCVTAVAKYDQPHLNARTWMLMPEFWVDIVRSLRGEDPNLGPEPAPGEEPTLNSINPSSADIGSADVTMNVNGNNFTPTSVIYFNGGPETTVFVDNGKLTTVVKPSLVSAPIEVPVWVQQGTYKTAEKSFEFTETVIAEEESQPVPEEPPVEEEIPPTEPEVPAPEEPPADERIFPSGPHNITLIEDHADGIAITAPGSDMRVGDAVYIEATGTSYVNGTFTVLSMEGEAAVVDNNHALVAPIENRGRVTINSGA